MPSSYTDLGIELMVTGENSGTWGDKTNTNLNIINQAAAGYQAISIAGGANTTTLGIQDGSSDLTGNTNAARNLIIDLTGTITGNQVVTVPDSVEKSYIVNNNTTGAFTVEFKTVSGTGVTFSAADKGQKFLYSNGTDIVDIVLASPPGGSNTQIQFNDNDAFGGSANLIWDGSNVTIGAQGDLRLADSSGGEYVALQAPTTVASNVTFTLPGADGTADQVLTTNGSGVLSFATISGGASWQAVITADPANAVAGYGYFCNTTSAAFTVTLPTSPSLGDFVSFIDYAGTFDTNNLTIARNGKNIQGVAEDLTVSVERAGLTLVFVDNTQGWLLQNK
jgi:hypothetical protein